jgi:hypothetical protein
MEYGSLKCEGSFTSGALFLHPIRSFEDPGTGRLLHVKFFDDADIYVTKCESVVCMTVEELDGKFRRRFFAQKIKKSLEIKGARKKGTRGDKGWAVMLWGVMRELVELEWMVSEQIQGLKYFASAVGFAMFVEYGWPGEGL